ncbi:MAG: hypothetical protein V3U19_07575 [Thermodesulfobacteriota bacterium]
MNKRCYLLGALFFLVFFTGVFAMYGHQIDVVWGEIIKQKQQEYGC